MAVIVISFMESVMSSWSSQILCRNCHIEYLFWEDKPGDYKALNFLNAIRLAVPRTYIHGQLNQDPGLRGA